MHFVDKASGGDTDNCESCDFHKVELSNLHKIEKYSKEIGEKSGKLINKTGKIGTFHRVTDLEVSKTHA